MLYSKNSVTSLELPRRASLWVSISFSLEEDLLLFFTAEGSLLREDDMFVVCGIVSLQCSSAIESWDQ